MDLQITLNLKVDDTVWANEYGLTAAEAAQDAPGHISEIVVDAVTERAKQLGTFQLVTHSVVDRASTVAGLPMQTPPKLHSRLPWPDSRYYSTADPRVVVARWGHENWRTCIEYDGGWDHTGPPHQTLEAAIASTPDVVFRSF